MTDFGVGTVGLGRIGWLHAEHLGGAVRGARLVAAAVTLSTTAVSSKPGTRPAPSSPTSPTS